MVSSRNKKVAGTLVAIAFRPFVGDAADGIGRAISSGPKDDLQRLMEAMAESQDKGWRALEIGLRGDSMFQKAGNLFSSDNGAVQQQIKAFLAAYDEQDYDDEFAPKITEEFKAKCLKELVTARKRGVIPGDAVPADRFSSETSVFPGAASPAEIRDAESEVLRYAGASLAVNGFNNLSSYISMSPKDGSPILAIAVQYFFRRAVESDPALANLLQVQRLEKISDAVTDALEKLDDGFNTLGNRLSEAFDSLSSQVSRVQEGVDEIQDKLDQWQLEESKRQEAIDAERAMMLSMIQQMSLQISQLTNTPINHGAEVNPDDNDAVDQLRREAEAAIEAKRTTTSSEDQQQLEKLAKITKQFDTVRKRLFTHLPSTRASDDPNLLPSMTANAGGVFKVKKRTLSSGNRVIGKASFNLRLTNLAEPFDGISVEVVNARGSMVRDLKTVGGAVSSSGLPPGRYTFRIRSPREETMTCELKAGSNSLPDWNIDSPSSGDGLLEF